MDRSLQLLKRALGITVEDYSARPLESSSRNFKITEELFHHQQFSYLSISFMESLKRPVMPYKVSSYR